MRYFPALIVSLLLFSSLPAQAYEGLIAPPAEDKNAAPAKPAAGYQGLIAAPPAPNENKEPAGYQGLITGAVPKPAEAPPQKDIKSPRGLTSVAAPPQQTQGRALSTGPNRGWEEISAMMDQYQQARKGYSRQLRDEARREAREKRAREAETQKAAAEKEVKKLREKYPRQKILEEKIKKRQQ